MKKPEQNKLKVPKQGMSQGGDKKKQQVLTTGSTICSQKYLLSHMVGKGTFGQVYIGILAIDDKQNGVKLPKQVAIKVENDQEKSSQLPNQIQILNNIRKDSDVINGFPQVYSSGIQAGNHYIVMELLGPNLQDLLSMCGSKFSLKTTLLLAIQIFEKIQFVHSKGYVYRDIKPENFVMGIQQHSSQLYLIDFGLSKSYKDTKTQLFIPYKQNVSIAGTIRYASLNSHLGIQQTRRDDLQAIVYMLVYFLKGQLPWQGLKTEDKFQKDHVIMQGKLKISSKQLCQQLPFEIHNVFDYIKSLDFYQDPDYKYIMSQLSGLYERMGFALDFQYDWVTLNRNVQHHRGNLHIQLKFDQFNGPIHQNSNQNQDQDKLKQNQRKQNQVIQHSDHLLSDIITEIPEDY